MARTFLLAAVTVGLLVVQGGRAAPPAPKGKKPRPATQAVLAAREEAPAGEALTAGKIVTTLHSARMAYDKDLQATPLAEVLADLANRYKITFVINKTAFDEAADQLPDAKATKLCTTKLDGTTLVGFLDIYLRGLSVPDVTYMVRPGHVEITTRQAAQAEIGLPEAVNEAKTTGEPADLVRAKARLNLPLVCVAVENQSLGAVLGDLTRVYGLNIVIDQGARQQTKTMLTEQLLNVPADTALELLAGQAGMSVARKGNTFRVTGGM